MKINKLSIIISAYNEEKTIAEIIDRVEKAELGNVEKEIIIVNDGSLDNTEDIIKQYVERHIIVNYQKNKGKGVAIRAGIERASGDYVIIQDADLEYNPNDIKSLLVKAENKNAQVVYGSRNLDKGKNEKAGWSYYIGGVFLSWLANMLYGIKITDEPTCYKLINLKLLKELNLESVGFEFCPEVTGKIAKRKIKIYEVPISYHPRSKKQGKKIKLKDGIIATWVLIKNRF